MAKNCRWVADSGSQQAVREFHTYMPQGYADITFTINSYNFCPIATNESLSQTIDWTSYPSYLNTAGYYYTYTNNAWVFTIPVVA